MSRYGSSNVTNNDSDFYSPLAEKRGLKAIQHFQTVVIHNPQIFERMQIRTNSHVWKYGDRYYKLANTYYGDPQLWWIIAWYNGYPTEVSVKIGDVLEIPLNFEQIIEGVGV